MKSLKLLVPMMLVLSLSMTQPVFAETPPGCNTNAVGISITPWVLGVPTAGPVSLGDIITYRVTVAVPPLIFPQVGCCFSGGDLSITLPDGTNVIMPPVGIVCDGSPYAQDSPVTYTVTLADVVAGSILALADYGSTVNYPGQTNGTYDSVSPQQTASATTSNELPVECLEPCIEITKSVDQNISKAGDEVIYTICLTNCGQFPLIDVAVTDQLLGGLVPGFPPVLNPGQQVCVDIPYIVQQGDPDPLINEVCVIAVDEICGEATACDDAIVDLVHPELTVIKECPEVSKAGDTVTNTITLINNSDVDLIIQSVTDSLVGVLNTCDGLLTAGGGQCVIQYDYVVQDDDPDPLINQVTVVAQVSGLPNIITEVATCETDLVHPCLDISKEADVPFSKVGDTINYTVTVTNCGDVELVDVDVSDSLVGPVDLGGTLSPGGSASFGYSYIVQPGDPDPLVNTATAIAGLEDLPNIIGPVQDSLTLDLVEPCISIEKLCEPSIASVGDTITYTITIENCGDVDLENVSVGDSLLGSLSALFVNSLTVGASDTKQVTRIVQNTDPNPLPNTATVDATVIILGNPVSDEASCEVEIEVTGDEGCTPGFWKNNAAKKGASAWEVYDPGDDFSDVFGIPEQELRDKGKDIFSNPTLLEALNANGGGINALARHATAALLNISSSCVNYAIGSEAALIAAVQDAIAAGDDAIQALHTQLAEFNEAGCPINQQGECGNGNDG